MGLRDRLKSLLQNAEGADSGAPQGPRPYQSPVQHLVDEAHARRQAEQTRREEAARQAEQARQAAAPRPAPAPSAPAPEPVAEDRQRAFMERARKGLLSKVAEAGGKIPLGELHDFSERKYFIAHRAFSNLMEEFVAEGLLDFDSRENTATLTRAGRALLGA